MRTNRLQVFAFMLTLAGCGTTIQPRVGTGSEPPGVYPGSPRLSPREPDRTGADNGGPVVDQICRTQGMRSGWIATQYVQAGNTCPASTDSENPYNAAVIERYSIKPIGATMVICADQSIPRDWVREHDPDVQVTCHGARVPQGRPTVLVIRRVSSRY